MARVHPPAGREPADGAARSAVRRGATVGGVIAANCQRPAAAALRHGARSGDRDAVRHARRKAGAIGRHGGEECRRPGYGEAHDRLVRHAGRDRGGQFQAAADAGGGAQLSAALRFAAAAIAARNPDSEGPAAARGHRPAESRAGAHSGQFAPGCSRFAPAATRPPWNATSGNSRSLGDGLAFEDERQQTLWRTCGEFHTAVPGGARGWRGGARLVYPEGVGSGHGVVSRARRWRARARASVMAISNEREPPRSGWPARSAAGWKAVIEFAPDESRRTLDLWPSPGGDFEIMQRVKHLFDPSNLLNRGRLYRRI